MSIEMNLSENNDKHVEVQACFWDQSVTICGTTDTLESWTRQSGISRQTIRRRIVIDKQTPVEALVSWDNRMSRIDPKALFADQFRARYFALLERDPRFRELSLIEQQLPREGVPDLYHFSMLGIEEEDQEEDIASGYRAFAQFLTKEYVKSNNPTTEHEYLVAKYYELFAALVINYVAMIPQQFIELGKWLSSESREEIQEFGLLMFVDALESSKQSNLRQISTLRDE